MWDAFDNKMKSAPGERQNGTPAWLDLMEADARLQVYQRTPEYRAYMAERRAWERKQRGPSFGL